MVMTSPQSGMSHPAPVYARTLRTWRVKSSGALRSVGSSESERCVLAMQTGSPPRPSSLKRAMLSSALISGAIAGMGGVSQVCGLQGQLTGEISAGFGYTGIVVATLAALTPVGVVLVAILLGDIIVGADSASLVLQVPPQMGQVLTATLLLVTVGVLVLRRYRPVRNRRDNPTEARAEVIPREEVRQ